ncbi:MAG: holo-ACP synthase [Candidatus Limnocylindria bacterium]
MHLVRSRVGPSARRIALPIRVGFDLVSVSAVEAELHADTRERYLARIYTDAEVAECATPRGLNAERLAARFAAKEATIKVLPVTDTGFSLREIETQRAASGQIHLKLTGTAAQLALSGGLTHLALSITHEAGMAGAVVVAEYHLG